MMPSVPVTSTEARGALTSLTEQHITQLIREAVKVQHHCKRGRIHLPNDKNSRGGYSGTTNKNDPRLGVLRRRLHANDINMALQWRGSEKIYATGMVGGGRFVNSSSRDDKKIMLKDYLKTEMKFKPPQEVGLTLHWLAVDGVQPDIPQNPSRYSKRKRQVVHRVDNDDDGDEGHASGDDGIQVTQLLPRLLSEELRLYFKRITVAVESGGANPVTRKNQDEALSSLSHDPGLQELAPFMINYVTKNLYNSVGNPEHCRTLIRMAQALLINPHIHLELYLHQLLPAILTMVVAERLSSKSFDNHWILRYEAALCLVQTCNLFGDDYATLKARVLKTLSDAIGPDRSLSTRYGGLVAITFFGSKAINAFVLPLALDYWEQSESALSKSNDLEQRTEIQMCEQATLKAISVFNDDQEAPAALDIGWEDLEDTFGDRLIMLCTNETEYGTCFI